ncbi:TldD/PmbA family protein [bacterium]|nr:TldD/PmbA family protein [bacterium]
METNSLPAQLAEIKAELPGMIALLEQRMPYVSALVTQESGYSLRIDPNHESIMEKSPRRGLVFSLFNGRYFQEWATDRLEKDYLWQKVRELRRRCEEYPRFESRFCIEPGERMERHFESVCQIDPDTISLSDMVGACLDLIEQVRAIDRHIVKVNVLYNDGKEHKIFVNRQRCLSSTQTICTILLVAIGSKHGTTQANSIGSGGLQGFEAIKFNQVDIQEMVDDLNLLFESKPLEPGLYDAVSMPEVSGIIAHEAFGHGVETDMFVKGRAKAADYLGKRVASSLVDMYDDPSLTGQMGSYFFDDEGWLAAPTRIIEQGILKQGLTDLRSATVLDLPRTANGRRESFERKVYARMSNTFFGQGTTSVEEMIAGVDRGILLKKSSSGMEDPKGWGIQVTVNLAREIKAGKLTSKIFAPVTLTGYMPDLLNSISQVGPRLGFMGVGGMCGKGHKEMVRISAGGPHLRFQARLG